MKPIKLPERGQIKLRVSGKDKDGQPLRERVLTVSGQKRCSDWLRWGFTKSGHDSDEVVDLSDLAKDLGYSKIEELGRKGIEAPGPALTGGLTSNLRGFAKAEG